MAMLSGGSTFLPKMKVCQNQTKEFTKKLPVSRPAMPGNFLVGFGDSLKNLGDSFLAVVGPYRSHALYLVDNEVECESFDMQSADFKMIEKKAKGAKVDGHAPMYGLDFLFWLPEVQQFGVYFFCKTARENAKPLLVCGPGRLVTVKAELTETKKHSWYKPVIHDPRSADGATAPTGEALAEALEAFQLGAGGGAEDEVGATVTTKKRDR